VHHVKQGELEGDDRHVDVYDLVVFRRMSSHRLPCPGFGPAQRQRQDLNGEGFSSKIYCFQLSFYGCVEITILFNFFMYTCINGKERFVSH
jgi:hypothetical protein